jgi:hypothetical protein
MAIYLSDVNTAYGPVLTAHWEKKENPQHYDFITTNYINPEPKRHILGLVGGNEVSLIKGNMVDLESDLRGINIPNTFCPWKQYQPPPKKQSEIVRNNVKTDLKIDVRPEHLPAYQMFGYPGVYAPEPMKRVACFQPEKY